MIFCMTVGGAFAIVGCVLALYHLIVIIRCLTALKVPAVIMICEKVGLAGQRYRLTYMVALPSGQNERLTRIVWLPKTGLPFVSAWDDLGKKVQVPYDANKNRLMPHLPIHVSYFLMWLVIGLGGIGLLGAFLVLFFS